MTNWPKSDNSKENKMNLFDRVTGNDMKKELLAFDERAKKLPAGYQDAWAKISTKIWKYSDLTGRNLMPVLNGVLGMLEESALEDVPIDQVIGTDIDDFIKEVAGAEGEQTYRDKWRQQLNANVAKKLKKLGDK